MKPIKSIQETILILLVCLITLPVMAGDARRRISAIQGEFNEAGDLEAEIHFGRVLAARILGSQPLLDEPLIQRYVNLVGSSVALFAGRPELKFYFGVLKSDEINAYAVPGGYVFITKGALDHMHDEAQLAAVLGHEIAHIVGKHVVKELNIRGADSSTGAGIAGLIGGATGGYRGALKEALDEATEIILNRGYTQADELEADRIGLILAAMAGYDPHAFLSFLETAQRFEPAEDAPKGDHPLHTERVLALRDILVSQGFSNKEGFRMERRFNANFVN
jgi:predicted Zn-dependent protease